MFSGIVQKLSKIRSITGVNVLLLVVDCSNLKDCKIGDSIAINGVCLTIILINMKESTVSFEAVPETLKRTNLKYLSVGSDVNYELSLRYGDFVGGHMVQGHVDCLGTVKFIDNDSGSWNVGISVDINLMRYLVDKGFITIDGMSITIVKVFNDHFTIAFIPHTIQHTLVKNYCVGTKVNIEVDPIGKHIHRYMEGFNSVCSS